MPALVHLSPFVHSVGGMQTLVRRNLELDRIRGIDSRSLALFDRRTPGVPAECRLGARGWWTLNGMQRALASRLPGPGATIIYYNGWGLPVLAGRDGAGRRLAFLATDWPGFAAGVTAMADACDGFICVSEELAAKIHATIPHYPAGRIHAVPLAAESFPHPRGVREDLTVPLQVGFVARLERDQKRADLLPALVRAVRRMGAPVRWRIVGDGSQRRLLERSLGGATDVTFHGIIRGDEYQHILGQLDAIVFLSEYEGTPLAMLDAMAAGAVPIFPAIGGLAERYASDVQPDCVYPAGNIAAAAQRIAALAQDPRLADLSRRCRERVAGHSPVAYAASYARALDELIAAPRISIAGGQRKTRLTDWLPLAILKRACPDAIWR